MRLYAYVILALIIALLAILFALQNNNLVTVQLFGWEYRQSLATVLLGTLGLGVLVGFLFSVPAVIRRELKATRAQKQAENLTGLVQEREQAISTASQTVYSVKQNYQDLLQSIGVIEPVTGLMRHDLLRPALVSQCKNWQSQGGLSQAPAVDLLLFQVKPTLIDGMSPDKVFASVAQTLQQHATQNTWFYGDGQGRFAGIASGMDVKSLTQYGETLQAALLNHPPALANGQAVEMDVAVGGAIADTKSGLDGHTLVDTAEAALEQAAQRGRNRVRVLQVS
jgi:GGDEF domain-containing protein